MFIDKTDREDFEPDFTIINACSKTNEKWREHALNSEVGIVFNIEKKGPEVGKMINHDSGLVFEIIDADLRRIKQIKIVGSPNR